MRFDTEKYFDSLDMFGIRLGLDATRELMEKAGHPEKNLRFIHIAGTNGKGSTGAMLERCFRQAGFKTGFYTSPHLIDIRERFRINGQAVSREEFDRAGKKLSDCAKKGRYSYFEFATVLAMEIFAAAQTEVVIWETGMGGRLDATNAVMPQACVITNIALDHQGHLGNTLDGQRLPGFADECILENMAFSTNTGQRRTQFRKGLHGQSGIADEIHIIRILDETADIFHNIALVVSHSLPPDSSFRLILIPGLMVVEIVQLRK